MESLLQITHHPVEIAKQLMDALDGLGDVLLQAHRRITGFFEVDLIDLGAVVLVDMSAQEYTLQKSDRAPAVRPGVLTQAPNAAVARHYGAINRSLNSGKPLDAANRFRGGAHIIPRDAVPSAETDLGWVSSACYSPTIIMDWARHGVGRP